MPHGTRAFFYPYSLHSLGTDLNECLELQRAMSDEVKRIILSFEF